MLKVEGLGMIIFNREDRMWNKLGDITLDAIEKHLQGEAEGRYEESLGCFILYNQGENGHMYEEDSTIEEIEGNVVFAKGCNGGSLDRATEAKVIEYIESLGE